MNKLDTDYQQLIKDILENGVKKSDRTGTGTKSVFGRTIRHKMSDGFPLLTTKKMHFKSIVTELLWFLKGDTNIAYLVNHNCNIWNGDAYKRFTIEREKILADKHHNGVVSARQLLEWYKDVDTIDKFVKLIKDDVFFAEKWGELGRIYGAQWRKWGESGNIYSNHNDYKSGLDQLAALINDLTHNPDSRRLMVTAWNPSELATAVLPPCHYGFQCWTKELTAGERLAYYNTGNHGNTIINVDCDWCLPPHEFNKEVHKWLNRYAPFVPQRSLSLSWNQRSVDTGLGLPYNIASYGLLLMLLAKAVNMVPDELVGNLADTHIYLDQIDSIAEQLDRVPFELPTVKISDVKYSDICEYTLEDITLSNYQSHEKIKLSLSN